MFIFWDTGRFCLTLKCHNLGERGFLYSSSKTPGHDHQTISVQLFAQKGMGKIPSLWVWKSVKTWSWTSYMACMVCNMELSSWHQHFHPTFLSSCSSRIYLPDAPLLLSWTTPHSCVVCTLYVTNSKQLHRQTATFPLKNPADSVSIKY